MDQDTTRSRWRVGAVATVATLLTSLATGTPASAAPTDLAHLQRQAMATATPHAHCLFLPLLHNGGFETPVVPGGFSMFANGTPSLGWSNTDGSVELWDSTMSTPPFDGNQLSEINVNGATDALYQDVHTVPGTVLIWRVAHRARNVSAGVDWDGMVTQIGPPVGPLVSQVPLGQHTTVIRSSDRKWRVKGGFYHVPAGQTITRIQFHSLFSAGGASYGNLVDGAIALGWVCF
jgi:hypothetical protein